MFLKHFKKLHTPKKENVIKNLSTLDAFVNVFSMHIVSFVCVGVYVIRNIGWWDSAWRSYSEARFRKSFRFMYILSFIRNYLDLPYKIIVLDPAHVRFDV